MNQITFPQLRQVNVARSIDGLKHPLEKWSYEDWLIALGGELGEALNVLKKLNRERDQLTGNSRTLVELMHDLADELADTVIYADLLAARIGVEIDDRSFEQFRVATHDQYTERLARRRGQLATFALQEMGIVAGVVADLEDGVKPRRIPALAIGKLVRVVDGIAWATGIDLGAAIVGKFNRTSEKYNLPHRLEAA